MSTPGRPRCLNVFKRTQIIEVVGAGGGLAAAARYVGCSVQTIRREALRNEDFARDLRFAQWTSESEPLTAIRKAAATQWRAAAWLLERTNPAQFDRRRVADAVRAQEVDDSLAAAVQSAVEEIADPELRLRVCRRLIAAARNASTVVGRKAFTSAPIDHASQAPDALAAEEHRQMNAVIDELTRGRISALRNLAHDLQNPSKCA